MENCPNCGCPVEYEEKECKHCQFKPANIVGKNFGDYFSALAEETHKAYLAIPYIRKNYDWANSMDDDSVFELIFCNTGVAAYFGQDPTEKDVGRAFMLLNYSYSHCTHQPSIKAEVASLLGTFYTGKSNAVRDIAPVDVKRAGALFAEGVNGISWKGFAERCMGDYLIDYDLDASGEAQNQKYCFGLGWLWCSAIHKDPFARAMAATLPFYDPDAPESETDQERSQMVSDALNGIDETSCNRFAFLVARGIYGSHTEQAMELLQPFIDNETASAETYKTAAVILYGEDNIAYNSDPDNYETIDLSDGSDVSNVFSTLFGNNQITREVLVVSSSDRIRKFVDYCVKSYTVSSSRDYLDFLTNSMIGLVNDFNSYKRKKPGLPHD
jgi:hypothetical protein